MKQINFYLTTDWKNTERFPGARLIAVTWNDPSNPADISSVILNHTGERSTWIPYAISAVLQNYLAKNEEYTLNFEIDHDLPEMLPVTFTVGNIHGYIQQRLYCSDCAPDDPYVKRRNVANQSLKSYKSIC